MKDIYLSAYCANFDNYELLKSFIDGFTDFQLGIEYATNWTTEGFHEKMARVIDSGMFKGIPATMHSPFVELCTDPGSPAESLMEQTFTRACEYYRAMGATSMVFHTHEGCFPVEEHEHRRRRSLSVLLDWHDRLKAQGMNMTVENVGFPAKGNVLFRYDDFVRLFDELPEDVGCLIDTGHAMLNNWDIPALIRTLGTRIHAYHLHNNDGIHDYHYPQYDPDGAYTAQQEDELMAAIARYSPDATLCLEYVPGARSTQEIIYRDIRRIVKMTEL